MLKPIVTTFIKSGMLFMLLLVNATSYAQSNGFHNDNGALTPGKLLDTVVDNMGHKYSLADISISKLMRQSANGHGTQISVASCSSGYFQMYLDAGCGMDGTDPASVARLNVLCQVLHDISDMINSPLSTSSSGQKINIYVRSLSSIGLGSSGFAGVASSFFNAPALSSVSGIADNVLWITLNSGTDAYKNVSSPVSTSGTYSSYGATYFHGLMAFQCDGSINWHTDLSTPPGPGEHDLYTVVFHEMMHALGFASMIDFDGTSRLGANFNYYSRYDQHLKTQGSTALLADTSSCDMYGWTFNPALTPLTVLSPGSTASTCPLGYQTGTFVNHTVCANAIQYVGSTTVPVYTSSCYEKGSSLSHFEDECYAPAGYVLSPPASNDEYFVMSNLNLPGPYDSTTNPGAMKRYLSPEECMVLCDIGYSVKTTFGNAADLNYKDYGGTACSGAGVAGINDGMGAAGVYTYFSIGTTPDTINGGTLGSILDNDYGAASFKCLEVVTGGGTLSATTGTSSTLVSFTPALGAYGVQLLRYVPVSATGVDGNITYVYVFVGDTGCSPTACDLVANGGFEDDITGGCGDVDGVIHCWSSFTATPDLFSTTSTTCGPVLDLPSILCVPNTYAHPLTPTPNDHFLGFIGYGGPGGAGPHCESEQSPLTSTIMSGSTYVVSCWAKIADNPFFSIISLPNHIDMGISTSTVPLAPIDWNLFALPAGLDSLCSFLILYPDHAWHYYSKTVTYNGADGHTLVVLNGAYLNSPLAPYPSIYETYTMVDDISIQPVANVCTFTLPDTMCINSGLYDLNSGVSIPGGTFFWQTDSSGYIAQTDSSLFDPASAYAATYLAGGDSSGIVAIGYTYTNPLGCTQTVYAETQIANTTLPAITGAANVCLGQTITLSNATPGGTWISSYGPVASVGSATGVVTGISGGTVVIDYVMPGGCFISAVVTVNPAPISGGNWVSVGGVTSLSDPSAGGTWSSSNTAIATVGSTTGVVSGVTTGTATITYTTPSGCEATVVITVVSGAGVSPATQFISPLAVIPSPNNGAFTISGYLQEFSDANEVKIEVLDLVGKAIYKDVAKVENGMINKNIKLGDNISAGVYVIRLVTGNTSKILRFTIEK